MVGVWGEIMAKVSISWVYIEKITCTTQLNSCGRGQSLDLGLMDCGLCCGLHKSWRVDHGQDLGLGLNRSRSRSGRGLVLDLNRV